MNIEIANESLLAGVAPPIEGCSACAAPAHSIIYSSVADPLTFDHFKLAACSECGLAFTLPRPAEMERYYPNKYRAYRPIVSRLLRAMYTSRVSKWAKMKPNGSSILEIGCGPGLMLDAFQRRGWRVMGIERNQNAAEVGRHGSKVEIVSTPIAGLPSELRFDIILMFHVLEHIDDPLKLLRECTKRLSRDGMLIVAVPNFASWQARFTGPKWFHLDVPRHLSHFTPETLSLVVERAGMQVNSISFASLEHDPFGWVESAISRITGRMNTLSRFLMGLDKFSPIVALALVLGFSLTLPALLLSTVSWLAKRGAIMEVTATRARAS